QKMWERALPAMRRAGGARSGGRCTYKGEHLAALMRFRSHAGFGKPGDHRFPNTKLLAGSGLEGYRFLAQWLLHG
ncbi:hypothetical protein, partial [Pseudomonas japonica]|uniref:hypothetical protein n=1 Tax=Pseudomonas japonica TaxID=256466 RepID=UPI001C3F41C9